MILMSKTLIYFIPTDLEMVTDQLNVSTVSDASFIVNVNNVLLLEMFPAPF